MNFSKVMVNSYDEFSPVFGKTVLEIGSDTGLQAATGFRSLGADKVIASNIYKNWCAITPPSGVEVREFDAKVLHEHIPSNSIDRVFGINVLEHLPDLEIILDSIHKILKPGGTVLLHGHPIWSSAKGHHIVAPPYHFATDNPVPLWGHLFMSTAEVAALTKELAVSEDVRDSIFKTMFGSEMGLSRRTRLSLHHAINTSEFEVANVAEDPGDVPDKNVLAKIAKTPWWNAHERYDIRQITFKLRKAD